MSNVIFRIHNNTDEFIRPLEGTGVTIEKGALVGFINPVMPRSTEAIFQVMQVMGQDGTEGEVILSIGIPATEHFLKILFSTQANGRNKFCVMTHGMRSFQVRAPAPLAPAVNVDVTFTLDYASEDARKEFQKNQVMFSASSESPLTVPTSIPDDLPPATTFDDGVCIISPVIGVEGKESVQVDTTQAILK